MFDIRRVNTDTKNRFLPCFTQLTVTQQLSCTAWWDGYIYFFFLQHPLLPEAPTSSTSHLSTFPGRVSEPEPGWGAPWGC